MFSFLIILNLKYYMDNLKDSEKKTLNKSKVTFNIIIPSDLK